MGIDVNARLLGMMAVEKRLITEKQLTECLNLHEFFDQRPLAELLLEKGYLTSRQLAKLKSILEREVKGEAHQAAQTASKDRFGILAIRSRLVRPDQLDESLREQKELAGRGFRIPIGQILMSKGYLTPEQVWRILQVQGKNYMKCESCGAAYTVFQFDPDEFYRCKKCDALLEEAPPAPIPREAIERRLQTTEEDLEMLDEDEDQSPGLSVIDL